MVCCAYWWYSIINKQHLGLVDWLTKPSDIMHLTKILNIFLIFKENLLTKLSQNTVKMFTGDNYTHLNLVKMSLFCSFDQPVLVRCMTSDGFAMQSKRALIDRNNFLSNVSRRLYIVKFIYCTSVLVTKFASQLNSHFLCKSLFLSPPLCSVFFLDFLGKIFPSSRKLPHLILVSLLIPPGIKSLFLSSFAEQSLYHWAIVSSTYSTVGYGQVGMGSLGTKGGLKDKGTKTDRLS